MSQLLPLKQTNKQKNKQNLFLENVSTCKTQLFDITVFVRISCMPFDDQTVLLFLINTDEKDQKLFQQSLFEKHINNVWLWALQIS